MSFAWTIVMDGILGIAPAHKPSFLRIILDHQH